MWVGLAGLEGGMIRIIFAITVPCLILFVSQKLEILPKGFAFKRSFFPYACWLFKEIFFSAINVIRFAWRPNLGISPALEPVKSIQKTDEGVVLYANSITLTPGTVTVNIKGNNLLVHSLDRSIMDDLQEGEMDRRIAEIVR